MSGYCIDWEAGASAQMEIFSPGATPTEVYQLKYVPAFRSTIRPPIEERNLGPGELTAIDAELDSLTTALKARDAGVAPPPGAAAVEAPIAKMEMLGNMLLDLVVPPYVQADFRTAALSLELGMDEALLQYPWELMYDGAQFLSLKHSIGRFVNGANFPMDRQTRVQPGQKLEPLTMLVISVSRPLPRNGLQYEPLLEAEAETKAILDSLVGIDGLVVKTLINKQATVNAVYEALKEKPNIVHFNGHAHFDDDKPKRSGLVLHDRDMTTGQIASFFGAAPPILCFVNACETAKAVTWKERYSIFGLAKAFLETGSYLLGSRWKINDQAAAHFAEVFYKSLLVDGKSLGESTRTARVKSREAGHDEFAWASYVLYGDPRVRFSRIA